MTGKSYDSIPFDLDNEKPSSVSEPSDGKRSERNWANSSTQFQITKDVVLKGFIPLGNAAFDSIYFRYPGIMRKQSVEDLEVYKLLASKVESAPDAQIQLNSHLFHITRSGRNGHLFTLLGDFFEIEIGSNNANKKHIAGVKILARWLLSTDPIAIEKEVRQVLLKLCEHLGPEKVVRADIKQDFCYINSKIEGLSQEQFICSSPIKNPVFTNDVITNWRAGLRSSIASRLYNKTAELLSRKTDDMAKLWAEVWTPFGWDPSRTTWRQEYEVHEDPLQEFGIHTVEDLVNSKDALWERLTWDASRLVILNKTDATRSRSPLHPLWKAIRYAGVSKLDFVRIKRTRKSREPAFYATLQRMVSPMATIYAIEGYKDDMKKYVLHAIEDFLDHGKMPDGTTALDALAFKVKQKRQSLNIGLNDPTLFNAHRSVSPKMFTSVPSKLSDAEWEQQNDEYMRQKTLKDSEEADRKAKAVKERQDYSTLKVWIEEAGS